MVLQSETSTPPALSPEHQGLAAPSDPSIYAALWTSCSQAHVHIRAELPVQQQRPIFLNYRREKQNKPLPNICTIQTERQFKLTCGCLVCIFKAEKNRVCGITFYEKPESNWHGWEKVSCFELLLLRQLTSTKVNGGFMLLQTMMRLERRWTKLPFFRCFTISTSLCVGKVSFHSLSYFFKWLSCAAWTDCNFMTAPFELLVQPHDVFKWNQYVV